MQAASADSSSCLVLFEKSFLISKEREFWDWGVLKTSAFPSFFAHTYVSKRNIHTLKV